MNIAALFQVKATTGEKGDKKENVDLNDFSVFWPTMAGSHENQFTTMRKAKIDVHTDGQNYRVKASFEQMWKTLQEMGVPVAPVVAVREGKFTNFGIINLNHARFFDYADNGAALIAADGFEAQPSDYGEGSTKSSTLFYVMDLEKQTYLTVKEYVKLKHSLGLRDSDVSKQYHTPRLELAA